MAQITLDLDQQQQLQHLARRGRDARAVRRAQALLWVAQGEPPRAVAERLGVSRETVYAWLRRLREHAREPLLQGLRDQPRCGRPAWKGQAVVGLMKEVIRQDPQQWGYRASGWTAALLKYHLQQQQGVAVSIATIRRGLKKLGYRWKRPRYVLARRDPFWRQAKGGSSAD
jgi:transposase